MPPPFLKETILDDAASLQILSISSFGSFVKSLNSVRVERSRNTFRMASDLSNFEDIRADFLRGWRRDGRDSLATLFFDDPAMRLVFCSINRYKTHNKYGSHTFGLEDVNNIWNRPC